MPARIIALGDIHGCSVAFRTLLDAISPQDNDTIITLGDYVDRGPDSRGVLDQLVELVHRCTLIPLRGNHEIMMLDSFVDREMFDFWLHCGGESTIASYGGSLDQIPSDHMIFLRGLRPYHETESHLFVHANYHPDLPLSQTPDSLLYWEHVSPWIPRPHFSGKTMVMGHTPQPEGKILDAGHLLCLDTYCFGGGWLTAMDMGTRKLWQSNQQGELRERKA